MTEAQLKADEEQRRERNWDPAERWYSLAGDAELGRGSSNSPPQYEAITTGKARKKSWPGCLLTEVLPLGVST